MTDKRYKHGHANDPTYRTWMAMIQRCTNPKRHNFKYYGGKGISVCEQWRTFSGFLADMGERPQGMTLDRIDAAGNYEPSNCRWASRMQQAANRPSFARMVEVDGQSMRLSEACRLYGICLGTAWDRLNRGWTAERAIKTKPGVQFSETRTA